MLTMSKGLGPVEFVFAQVSHHRVNFISLEDVLVDERAKNRFFCRVSLYLTFEVAVHLQEKGDSDACFVY